MKRICSIGLAAHVDAGKTTLTEQLLYRSGTLRHCGSVDAGTAFSDFLPVEQQRGISVRASCEIIQAGELTVNLLDTPGHADFFSEVERSLSVLDCGVLLLSGGIQAQTESVLEAFLSLHLPFFVFVNKLDLPGPLPNDIISELQERCPSVCFVPLYNPINVGSETFSVESIPKTELTEALLIAADNESLLEKYLSGIPITQSEFDAAIQQAVSCCRLCPVIFGSAKRGIGVDKLLEALEKYAPSAAIEDNAPFSARVFQVTHDRSMGKIAHIRLFSGSVKARQSVFLPRLSAEEKITQVSSVNGSRFANVSELRAGECGAVAGLSGVRAGDWLGQICNSRNDTSLTVPLLTVQIFSKDPAQRLPLLHALQELSDEDPLLDYTWVEAKQELHVKTTGRIQLEILQGFLLERYHIDAFFSEPSIIYKETPVNVAEGFDSYTMPKPCWAELRFRVEPLSRGSGLEYQSLVGPREIPYRYQHHVETALPRALKQGIHGWEVTDLRVSLIGGSYHEIHTHPLDFFVCTPMAIMKALHNAGTRLLEPILSVRLRADESTLGKTISLMVDRRAVFDSPLIHGNTFVLDAQIPASEAMDLQNVFASLTGGKGNCSSRFSHYADCPNGIGSTRERFGVDPLDRPKYILWARGAITEAI